MTKTVEIGEAKTIEVGDIKAINHIPGNPVAQARLAKKLMDEKQLDQADVAKALGVRQPWVSRLLKLLVLPEGVLKQVEEGELSATTAYMLTRLPEKERNKLLKQEDLTQHDVLTEVRKVSVTDDVLDLVEAPSPKQKGDKCPTCGRKY